MNILIIEQGRYGLIKRKEPLILNTDDLDEDDNELLCICIEQLHDESIEDKKIRNFMISNGTIFSDINKNYFNDKYRMNTISMPVSITYVIYVIYEN